MVPKHQHNARLSDYMLHNFNFGLYYDKIYKKEYLPSRIRYNQFFFFAAFTLSLPTSFIPTFFTSLVFIRKYMKKNQSTRCLLMQVLQFLLMFLVVNVKVRQCIHVLQLCEVVQFQLVLLVFTLHDYNLYNATLWQLREQGRKRVGGKS